MTTLHDIQRDRKAILDICRQHGGRDVQVFGSVARHQEQPHSDVDFLVALESDRSLLDRIELTDALSDYLGTAVDVVSPRSLPDSIRSQVLQEAVSI
jgi:predicted nucleotidyltransferase